MPRFEHLAGSTGDLAAFLAAAKRAPEGAAGAAAAERSP
jgi:hypothetical protein